MEYNNIYYCADNVIIDNFEVKRYEKEKYIVMDYFILDLKTGKIETYDKVLDENFPKTMKNAGKPVVYKEGDYKKIAFYKDQQEPIVVILDKSNNIVALENKNIKRIPSEFLYYNKKLKKISFPNVEFIDDNFLHDNIELNEINIPKVKKILSRFLYSNSKLEKIDLPEVEYIDECFLNGNIILNEINIPKLKHL